MSVEQIPADTMVARIVTYPDNLIGVQLTDRWGDDGAEIIGTIADIVTAFADAIKTATREHTTYHGAGEPTR